MVKAVTFLRGLLASASLVAASAQAQGLADHAALILTSAPAATGPAVDIAPVPNSPALDNWSLAAPANDAPPAAQSAPSATIAGPVHPVAPSAATSIDTDRYRSFGAQTGAVKGELAVILTYMTAINIGKVIRKPQSFRFYEEGWFGKSTETLGVDKFAHAYNTYIIADFLHAGITRKSGGGKGEAVTAAVLASGLGLYTEMYDAHHQGSGFTPQDILFNSLGAGLSILRNTTPGLKDKLDFRMMVIPNSEIYSLKGNIRFAQQRFLLAATLAGFDAFKNTPLRFVELHAGYYATGFTADERAAGVPPKRRPFVGIGLNAKELFFRNPRSGVGRAAGSVLDYVQIPYTAIYSSDAH